MPIDERSISLPEQWAKDAQTVIPAPPVPGIAYRNTAVTPEQWARGQEYSRVADSAQWNQMFWMMSGLLQSAERYGVMPYSPFTDYPELGICMGADGQLYQALQPSGPNNGGAQPTNNDEFWKRALAPATTTSRGIVRVATQADFGIDAPENGPACLVADGDYLLPASWVSGLFVGDIRLLPFRAEDLATHCPGWLFCNGDRFANGTATAEKLNALPANLKEDFGITNDGTHTTAPNLFYTDGRGVFLRAVDGTTRQVGNTQSDTIRNLTGELTWGLGGWRPGSATGVFQQGSHTNQYGADYQTGPAGYSVKFDASGQVPTGSENKPLDMGMTPAIFIGS